MRGKGTGHGRLRGKKSKGNKTNDDNAGNKIVDSSQKDTTRINATAGEDDGGSLGGGIGGSGSGPRAQRCFLVGSRKTALRSPGDQEVLSRFPHQFAPLLTLPFRVQNCLEDQGYLPGILLRMPLRRAPSTLSSYVCQEADVKLAVKVKSCLSSSYPSYNLP